jgi:hypothetical protein
MPDEISLTSDDISLVLDKICPFPDNIYTPMLSVVGPVFDFNRGGPTLCLSPKLLLDE